MLAEARSGWLHDDRGHPATLAPVLDRDLDAAGPFAAALGPVLKRWERPSATSFRAILAVIPAFGGVAGLLITGVLGLRGDWTGRIAMGGGIMVGVVAAMGLVRVRERRYARALASAVLGTGHCPSCHYEMRGLAAASDGCTVCPECGAAWRVRRGSSASAPN